MFLSSAEYAHFSRQVGIKTTALPIPRVTFPDIFRAILAGACEVYRRPYGAVAVQMSKVYKRIQKARAA